MAPTDEGQGDEQASPYGQVDQVGLPARDDAGGPQRQGDAFRRFGRVDRVKARGGHRFGLRP
jgi:hypothetical protein